MSEYYVSFDLHLFNKSGQHYAIPLDYILNKVPKYIGIIKSFDKETKKVMIEIKGEIIHFSRVKYLPLITRGCDINNPPKV